jgi:hypothetical protein
VQFRFWIPAYIFLFFASGYIHLLSFDHDFFFRSEIAWKNANYAQILEYLREEYELNQRFGSLDFKLKFVEVAPCIFILLYSAKVGFFIFFEFSFVLTICYCNSTTFIFFKRSSKIDGRICWSGVS